MADRLTVNLTESAHADLHAAVRRTRDSVTDTVNRALHTYALVTAAAQHEGIYWVSIPNFDDRGDLHLMVARGRPRRRWWQW